MSHAKSDLDYDATFHRRDWMLQVAGKLAIAAAVGAGLAGVFGDGPASEGRVSDSQGSLSIAYERYGRLATAQQLRIEVAARPGAGSEVGIRFEPPYLDRMRLEQVVPPPVRVVAAGQRQTYVFAASRDAPVRVAFRFEPRSAGTHAALVGIAGGPQVAFSQFVYP